METSVAATGGAQQCPKALTKDTFVGGYGSSGMAAVAVQPQPCNANYAFGGRWEMARSRDPAVAGLNNPRSRKTSSMSDRLTAYSAKALASVRASNICVGRLACRGGSAGRPLRRARHYSYRSA